MNSLELKDAYGDIRTGEWYDVLVGGVDMLFRVDYEGGLSLKEQIYMMTEE